MIIDGKTLAQQYLVDIRNQIATLACQPSLAVILVGNHPASQIYVKHKQRACEAVGIHSLCIQTEADISEAALIETIQGLNEDPEISGILVQLPLPAHIRTQNIIEAIHPDKDVDGFHPLNLGKLAQGQPRLRPCTPFGVMKLLESINVGLAGKHAVIVGTSNIVGKPMALELLQAGATITLCHRRTQDLAFHTRQADILIAAAGSPRLITAAMIKSGSIVIDIGITRLADGSLSGDVDFAEAQKIAAYITPVPGGVGPMTVAMLMQNTYLAAKMAAPLLRL